MFECYFLKINIADKNIVKNVHNNLKIKLMEWQALRVRTREKINKHSDKNVRPLVYSDSLPRLIHFAVFSNPRSHIIYSGWKSNIPETMEVKLSSMK